MLVQQHSRAESSRVRKVTAGEAALVVYCVPIPPKERVLQHIALVSSPAQPDTAQHLLGRTRSFALVTCGNALKLGQWAKLRCPRPCTSLRQCKQRVARLWLAGGGWKAWKAGCGPTGWAVASVMLPILAHSRGASPGDLAAPLQPALPQQLEKQSLSLPGHDLEHTLVHSRAEAWLEHALRHQMKYWNTPAIAMSAAGSSCTRPMASTSVGTLSAAARPEQSTEQSP